MKRLIVLLLALIPASAFAEYECELELARYPYPSWSLWGRVKEQVAVRKFSLAAGAEGNVAFELFRESKNRTLELNGTIRSGQTGDEMILSVSRRIRAAGQPDRSEDVFGPIELEGRFDAFYQKRGRYEVSVFCSSRSN